MNTMLASCVRPRLETSSRTTPITSTTTIAYSARATVEGCSTMMIGNNPLTSSIVIRTTVRKTRARWVCSSLAKTGGANKLNT